jgi:hypothetical protein
MTFTSGPRKTAVPASPPADGASACGTRNRRNDQCAIPSNAIILSPDTACLVRGIRGANVAAGEPNQPDVPTVEQSLTLTRY